MTGLEVVMVIAEGPVGAILAVVEGVAQARRRDPGLLKAWRTGEGPVWMGAR